MDKKENDRDSRLIDEGVKLAFPTLPPENHAK